MVCSLCLPDSSCRVVCRVFVESYPQFLPRQSWRNRNGERWSRVKVAALYIDPRGPYVGLPGVDCYDEQRDARTYAGPWPVVAHPACGPWGRLHWLYEGGEGGADCALHALRAVRRFGGVLEHPAGSTFFRRHGLDLAPGQLDLYGGECVRVRQVEWGHACVKPTWLYIVGCRWSPSRRDPTRQPTHVIWGRRQGAAPRPHHTNTNDLLTASKKMRRLTPPRFALDLIDCAATARR